jgi:TRAP-type C4-dicarboxylate transport system substrate-binding protein
LKASKAVHILTLLALACSIFAVFPRPAQADPIVMKMGTATAGTPDDSQYLWMQLFKAMVERDSKGRIEVQLYPNSQLGSIPREIEDVQFGAIQGWVGAPEFLSGVDPRFQLLSAPGVFSSVGQFFKTLQDPQFNAAFLALGAEKGLKGIGLTYAVPAAVTLRRPVSKAGDIAGLKLRTLAGPLQSGEFSLLGATPVPMPLDQVMPALQQGAIDGVVAGITVASTFKYYTIARYLLELNQPYVATITVVSKTWFDALPADLQKIISDDGRKIAHDVYPRTVEIVTKAHKTWLDGGGQLIEISPAEQAQLLPKLAKVGADYARDKPEVSKLYELMVSAAGRYR